MVADLGGALYHAEMSDAEAEGTTGDAPSAAPEGDGPRRRRSSGRSPLTSLAVVLVICGVLAMVVPGLLRDGVCGLVACADVTPEIAVGRPEGTQLAVVVPQDAAGELQSLRLFEVTGRSPQETAGQWIVYRTGESRPTTIPLGEQPDGFATRTELEVEPTEGLWVIDASFGCSSTLVRFAPTELDPGFVTGGSAPEPTADFLADARSTVRCTQDVPAWQTWLFVLGAIAAAVGAVIGIVVVLRKPPPDDPDWYGP
jgi:hypothetical protein